MVLIGGLDRPLAAEIGAALGRAGLESATDGHRFPATHRDNVCNRGATGRGVQIEVPHRLRHGAPVAVVAAAVRAALGRAGP